MKGFIKSVGSIAVLLFLVSCGGGGGGDNAPTSDGGNTLEDYKGAWVSECHLVDGEYTVFEVELDGTSKLDVRSITYPGKYCITKERDVTLHFTVTPGNRVSISSNVDALEIDMTYQGYTLHLGEETYSPAFAVGTKNYDIIALFGDALFFGDDSGSNDASSAEKRPTTLDVALPFKKFIASLAYRGTWKTPCVPINQDIPDPVVTYADSYYSFKATHTLLVESRAYNDSACDSATLGGFATYGITVQGTTTTDGGLEAIQIYLPDTDGLIFDTPYTIMKASEDGEHIYFGEKTIEKDGSTAGKRPTTLQTDPAYILTKKTDE